MFYSLVPIIALVILLITNFDVAFNKRYIPVNKIALRMYRFFVISLGCFYITDILWGYLDPLSNKVFVTIDTSVYFIAMAITLFAWTLFVIAFINPGKAMRVFLNILGFSYVLLGVTLVIINFFTPIMFTYYNTASQEYNPDYARYIFLGLQFSSFIIVSTYAIFMAFKEKGYKHSQYIILGIFGLIMAGCITAQLYYPDFPIYSLGCCVGSCLIYAFIVVSQRLRTQEQLLVSKKKEAEQQEEITSTRQLAYIDPLTRAKNKHAFVELENHIDDLIHDNKISDFALIIFDLNDLKLVNDNYGHEAGDQYIINSCELILSIFKGAELYRFGGDEFIIILKDELFKNRYKLFDEFNEIIDQNVNTPNPVIAAGLSDYVKGRDNTLRPIFVRADERMYGRKRRLKEMKNGQQEEDLGNKSSRGISLMSLRYEMYDMFYRSSGVSLIDMLNGSSCDEIVEFDLNNDSFKQLYHVDGKYFVPAVGLSYRELLDFTYKHILHPDDRGVYMNLMQIDGFFERLKNARIPNFDFAHFRYKLQDGSYRWVEQVVVTGEEFGIPEGMFRMYVFDINNIKSRQLGQIPDESGMISFNRDNLTGLLNSKDFLYKAEELVNSDQNKKWCLVATDIEHFRLFDEWFGREKGDYLLTKIGVLLKEFKENNQAVAGYFGQDDFTLVCEYDEAKINALYDDFHELINSFGLSTGFLPAFGVALIEKDMVVVDALDRATIAVSRAKEDIKNRIRVYNYDMQFRVEQEYRILSDFIHAMQEDEITFYLQPQVHILTGQIVGAEALARWIKKDGTLVSPGQFVPILEKYGFVTDLDKYIWDKVCAWIKSWVENKHKTVPISINVSRIDIFNIDIFNHFVELCEKYKIPHSSLKIEITESAYAENMDVVDKLVKELRGAGFKVLMDDFGAGYSSLNMLSTLKIDAIKLDAQFLNIGDGEHQRGVHILESVVNMAKSMSMPIIMEGAEKKNQVDFLKELGVNYVQGYYFYKPMPITEFEKIISDTKNIDSSGFVVKSNEQFRIREFLDKNIYSDSMLNNVIGAVAIYSLNKDHVDIIRFNQQFITVVDVPDFAERLDNIEQFMPESDRPLLFAVLKDAKENKLMGATQILRFYRTNGQLSSFKMHFYYIGKKEGSDRFYGSATDVTELADLQDVKSLMGIYSTENMIFVSKISNKWRYNVISHSLSDVIGLSAKELEEELNSGSFVHRVYPQKDMKDFVKLVETIKPTKGTNLEKYLTVINAKKTKIKIHINAEYVGDIANNILYILRTTLVK